MATVVSPNPSANQADAAGQVSGPAEARRVAEQHRKNLQARRQHDLDREKFLIHIDGSGDNQYADILYGNRVAIPRVLSPYRCQENILGLIVDNQVSWHTTMPFRFAVETSNDARARERGVIDEAFANHVSLKQRLNELSGQAMYLAAAAGFCPIHSYWREDLSSDPYEPLYQHMGQDGNPAEMFQPRAGMVDNWVGNPWDTTFNAGARFGSVQASWYGRVLPAVIVRKAFESVLQGVSLEGSDRFESGSLFQRTLRKWYHVGTAVHGTSALLGAEEGEELIALVCREIAPGIDPEFPDGRLTIVALQGSNTTDIGSPRGMTGEPILLADQPLPAGRYSWTNIYSHAGFDDVHGKPFASDLVHLQSRLNLALSRRREYIERGLTAPTIVNGRLVDDLAEYGGYTLLETEATPGSGMPKVLELPSAPAQLTTQDIQEIRQAMYSIGGYQAASRGEATGGTTAYRAIVALQQADDTVHGPTNVAFRGSICHLMQTNWALFKTYGDVPLLLDVAGGDYAHLAESWIDRSKLSDDLPQYRLVNFAGTPEARLQQMLNLVTTPGADGQPLLTTEEFRRKCPDSTLYGADTIDPKSSQKRRAKTIAQAIRDQGRRFRELSPGLPPGPLTAPQLQAAGQMVFQSIEQMYPRLQDDDLASNLLALSEITQDETEDPIARNAAVLRQQLFYQWQAQMAAQQQQMQMQQEGQKGPGQEQQKPDTMSPEYIRAETHGQTQQQATA